MQGPAAGTVVWLTGLPASGKTTVARELVAILRAAGIVVLWLDSDDLRRHIMPSVSYEDAERAQFYAALAHLAYLGSTGGACVVVSATAPLRAHRRGAREKVARFVEVWLRCPLDVAQARDPKGLYAQARAGAIHNLPGVDAAYENPEHPELTFDTSVASAADIARSIWARLGP